MKPYPMSMMTRTFPILLVMALITPGSHAQENGLASPVAFNVAIGSDWGDQEQVRILGSLDVPLQEWLPQTSPDSRVRLAGVGIAVDTGNDSSDSRFRVGLLDLLLQRAWWSGRVRLIDLNRMGLVEVEDTWVEIGTGPGIHVGGTAGAFSIRTLLLGGRKRWKPDTVTQGSATGWHGGVAVMASLRLKQDVTLAVTAERLTLSGTDASWWSSTARASWVVAGPLTAGVHAEHMAPLDQGRWGPSWKTHTRAGASLTYRVR